MSAGEEGRPAGWWRTIRETPADSHLLRSYLAVLYRRRWMAAAVLVVVFGLFLVRTFTATPIYEATARILIDADSPSVVAFQDVVDTNRRAFEYFQTQYRLLTSRGLAKRALVSSGLMRDPAFRGDAAPAGAVPAAATPLTASRDAGQVALSESQAESAAIRTFLAGITVTPVRNSRLVDVTFASSDPAIAWKGANAAVEAFIQQTTDMRSGATRDAASFLTEMLGEQRAAVEQSELALQQYREQGDAMPAEDRENIVTERLAYLNESLTKARTDRIQKETAFEQVRRAGGTADQLDSVPAVRDNPAIQRLKVEIGELQRRRTDLGQELTERHPEMIKIGVAIEEAEATLAAQVRQLVESVRVDYEGAVALERAMSEALEKQRSEALALNRRGIDFGVLQRDADTNRKLYDALLQRTKEAGITEQLKTNGVSIVDPAELPLRPVRPNRTRDTMSGFGVALVLALGLVFTLELFDTRIKSPDDVTRRLRLPTLAMVPLCASDGPGGRPLLISADGPPNFIEAFRSLRTSILFASADRGSKSLLVSSTAPSEGKTLVACNLALSLAMAGQRVLLVDADMRRPKVHVQVGTDLVPGLSDVLVGNVTLATAARATAFERLSVLPAGTLPPNPPELLGSPQFAALMDAVAQDFDWVVLDSPPVRAVTDAAVIAHRASTVVFVASAEMTDADAAKVAIERLVAAKGRIAGVVLNRVQLRRHSYYYSQYYGRGDERYYVGHSPRA